MSLGRYGADDPAARKVRLHIMVDRKISEALGKIRTKRSVSEMVNGLLAIVVRQFDPGPSSPLIYELEKLFSEHEGRATASGDPETLAAVAMLWSHLSPYIDLARNGAAPESGAGHSGGAEEAGGSGIGTQYAGDVVPRNVSAEEDFFYRAARGYDWYAVPVICHEKPMTYLRRQRAWKCFVCGDLVTEGGSPRPTGGRASP